MSWIVVYLTPTAEQVMFDPRFALFLAGWPRSGDYGLLVELIEASVGTGIPGAEPQRRREQSSAGPLRVDWLRPSGEARAFLDHGPTRRSVKLSNLP